MTVCVIIGRFILLLFVETTVEQSLMSTNQKSNALTECGVNDRGPLHVPNLRG